MPSPVDPTRYREVKDKLNVAFRNLRKLNYIARQNHLCCGSCASYSCFGDARTRDEKGKPVRGAVYYHRQSNDDLVGARDLYIGYGAYEDTEGNSVVDDRVVGRTVSEVLRTAGLTIEWDGSPDTCVKVIFYPEFDEEKVKVVSQVAAGEMDNSRYHDRNTPPIRKKAIQMCIREELIEWDSETQSYVVTDGGQALLAAA